MSAIDEHHLSDTRRKGAVAALVVVLLLLIAFTEPVWLTVLQNGDAGAVSTTPASNYTPLEFARAVERAIRGS